MPVVGIAEVLVKPVATGAQKAISQEMNSAATAAGKSSGSKMGSALGGAMKLGVGAAVGGVVGVLALAITKGFGRLQAIEQARAKLTGLGHDAKSVAAIMKNATASVKGTAFGLDEAATVAAGAVASGIKPGKDLERVLKLVADSASIANVPMSEMGAIFNKVSSSGKLQGDVLAQLGDKGIPIVSLLGKSMGKTSEEIYDMSKKGQIDFAMFSKAMEQGMGGAALKSGNTLQGSFKNTLASLGRIGANLLSGVYPLFTKFFQGLMKWMEPLEAKAKVVGEALGVGMTRAGLAIQGVYSILAKGDFIGGLGVDEDSKIVAFLFNVREGFIKLADVLKGTASILFKGDFIGGLGVDEDSKVVDFLFRLRDGFISIGTALGLLQFSSWDSFQASLGAAGGTVGGAFTSITDSLTTLGPAFQEFGRQLPNISGALLKLGGVSLNFLVAGLGFLADHVDTIIKFMPLIVGAFIAWRIATAALATAQYRLQMGQVAAAPILLANNILRYASVRAETALSVATGQSTASTHRSIAAKIADRVATVAGTVATWAATVAQKAAAVATRLLGVAIKFAMGPVGLIIAGITLLVAGLIWFFTQTKLGKEIVQNVFAAIKVAAAAVVSWFQTTALPFLTNVIKAIGGFFVWLYEKAVKPVFDGMMIVVGAVVSWFQSTALPIIQGVIGVIGAVFTWLWTNVVKPVFGFIQAYIGAVFLVVRGIFQVIVSVVKNILAPVIVWLWKNVVVPAFQAIGAFIGWVWNTVISVVFAAIKWYINNVLAPVITWLWKNVVQPVFKAIGDYIGWVWKSVITPVFDALKWYVNNVLAPVFTWLWKTIIKPAFDGISASIKWAWENGIRPVFDFLKKAITETIPNAFQKGVDGVKKIWDTLLDIAKAPVRFVVNTVINDGLIGAFNTVAGILPGVDKLPKVALPAGFHDGGYTGNLPWGSVAGVVHGDEQVIRAKSRRSIEGRLPGFLDALNQFGAGALQKLGYRNGGRVNPVKNMALTQGYSAFHDGIDIGVGVGTPVFAADAGRITHAGPGYSAPGVWGGNEVHLLSNGVEQWYAHLSQIGVKLGQMVAAGQQIALSGNTGISSGPHLHFGTYNGGWPNAINPLSYLAGAQSPKGGKGGDGGGGFLDPLGAIRGLADKVVGQISKAFPMGGFMVDAVTGLGKKMFGSVIDWAKQKLGIGSVAGQSPLLYDQGGLLRPGLSQIVNRTQKPEYILNPQQWQDMHRLATSGGSGFEYSPTYQWMGDDPYAVMAKDKLRMGDTLAAYGIN